MQNAICYLTFDNRLGFAPSCNDDAKVGRVLDLGTGTGLWAIEYADLHPEAEVLGVDLSPIQPADVPPNLAFEIDDIEEEWLYSQKFDYIHGRFLNGSLADWKSLIAKAYEFTEPGGYFELQENDGRFTADDDTLLPEAALSKFGVLIREACAKFGRTIVDGPLFKDMMIEAGFEDVTLKEMKWPSNPWPKDPHHKKIGEWNYHNFYEGAEALALAPLTRAHGWTKEEVQVFLIDVRKNFRDPNIHSYLPIYTIVGRKPLKQKTPAPT
ncbi:methyltransferase domain-containing protein [Colletotrichum musicola]|uniref:Methyltransferase domain-containing protein n=1 Tax=Colletotrichum musicola TaxID=2175873 RepID=A0A8H6JQ07_9PEZI|nr:methyltransferase domain-containing protein [Colletotrichum musicola]